MDEHELSKEKIILQQRKVDKSLIKRGYTRVQEKVKEIRQKFSEAIISGRRSGSSKIVIEFYDQLVHIWGGAPASEPMPSGICTQDVNSVCDERQGQNSATTGHECEDDNEEDNASQLLDVACNDKETEQSTICASAKRESSSPIAKLIDKKRKHLERKLSAAQRDQLLLK